MVIYFIGTCFVSTGALLGALNAKNPFPLFGIAFGIWALFLWRYDKWSKKMREKRNWEKRDRVFKLNVKRGVPLNKKL